MVCTPYDVWHLFMDDKVCKVKSVLALWCGKQFLFSGFTHSTIPEAKLLWC
jgi:hypothetical protein